MVGMIQIITWLLAAYMIVKGFEFVQMAVCAPPQHRRTAFVLAYIMLAFCIASAVVAISWQEDQASRVGGTGAPPSLLR